jgi:hypothetical protein
VLNAMWHELHVTQAELKSPIKVRER